MHNFRKFFLLLFTLCLSLFTFNLSAQALEAVTAPVTVNPALEIGPYPEAATDMVISPKPLVHPYPKSATASTVTSGKPRSMFSDIKNYWERLEGRFGVGLNIGYLASFGPGDRYLYTPVFLLEGLARIPLNQRSFLAPAERYSVSVGLESGYYGSSAEETRGQDDPIRGEYPVTQDLNVVPLNVNLYFDLPLSSLLSVSLGAGLGASFASLHSSYDTPFVSGEHYGFISETSFSYQFIGRCRYRTGSIGEAIAEVRDRQASFRASGHPESKGDLGGLSFGIAYFFLF